MSKVTKNERISTLEDAVAMNWSDMKKIETKISRAMTDMATRISNISLQLEGQQRQIHLAADSIGLNKQAIIMLENKAEPKPQLKQLDQSVFKEWADCWKFFAIDEDGDAWRYREKPKIDNGDNRWSSSNTAPLLIGRGYDASNWQNSLIERSTAKDLTGSELCKAMLARGDKYVMCLLSDMSHAGALSSSKPRLITNFIDGMGFIEDPKDLYWHFAVPINNQGEPLTASEAGL